MAQSSIDFTEGTGTKISTHVVVRNGETQEMEVIAPGAGVLPTWNWSTDATAVSATGLSSISVNTQGAGRIVVGIRADDGVVVAGDEASFMLVFYAADGGIIGAGAEVTAMITAMTEPSTPTNLYATTLVFANDACAATVGFYLTGLPGSATSIDVVVKAA